MIGVSTAQARRRVHSAHEQQRASRFPSQNDRVTGYRGADKKEKTTGEGRNTDNVGGQVRIKESGTKQATVPDPSVPSGRLQAKDAALPFRATTPIAQPNHASNHGVHDPVVTAWWPRGEKCRPRRLDGRDSGTFDANGRRNSVPGQCAGGGPAPEWLDCRRQCLLHR